MIFQNIRMEKLNKIVSINKQEIGLRFRWNLCSITDEEIETQQRARGRMVWTLWPWTMVSLLSQWLLDLICCFHMCFLLFDSFCKQLLLTLCSLALILGLFPYTQRIKYLIKITKLIFLKYLFSIRWGPVKCNLLIQYIFLTSVYSETLLPWSISTSLSDYAISPPLHLHAYMEKISFLHPPPYSDNNVICLCDFHLKFI